MKEQWKNIPGYNRRYQISNYGNVRSMNYKNSNKPGLLKQHINNWGYLAISFLHNNKRQTYIIHRLVAQLFIPNIENKPHINHIDGNKQNNRIDNLEWVTPKENAEHAHRTGLNDKKNKEHSIYMKMLKSEDSMNAILKEEQVINIRKRYKDGNITQQKLADEYGVDRSTIGKIVTNKIWNKLKEFDK